MRGDRPWEQFDRLCRDVAQRQGSRLRASQLRDPAYLAEMEQLIEKQPKIAESRPTLEAWTPEVEALHMVANDIRIMTQILAKVELSLHQGPETPADIIAARKKTISLSKIAEVTGGE